MDILNDRGWIIDEIGASMAEDFSFAKGRAASREMVLSLQVQFSNWICVSVKRLEMVEGVIQNGFLRDFGLSRLDQSQPVPVCGPKHHRHGMCSAQHCCRLSSVPFDYP